MDDVKPDNWHPSWIRYAEYGEQAVVLHKAPNHHVTSVFNVCVIPARSKPVTDNHAGLRGRRYNFTTKDLDAATRVYEIQSAMLLEEQDVAQDAS